MARETNAFFICVTFFVHVPTSRIDQAVQRRTSHPIAHLL